MRRRYVQPYSARRNYKKVRYSNETSTFLIQQDIAANNTSSFPTNPQGQLVGKVLVDAATIQGTRKVKNMTLSISATNECPIPILCAVVYVPQGTNPSSIQVNAPQAASTSLYEPNQNVIMQFVLNPVFDSGTGTNVQRFKTRLARNLDSGDAIYLVCAPAFAHQAGNAYTCKLSGTFNYAISF